MLHWTFQLVEMIHGCCWIILSVPSVLYASLHHSAMEMDHTMEWSIYFSQKACRKLAREVVWLLN